MYGVVKTWEDLVSEFGVVQIDQYTAINSPLLMFEWIEESLPADRLIEITPIKQYEDCYQCIKTKLFFSKTHFKQIYNHNPKTVQPLTHVPLNPLQTPSK